MERIGVAISTRNRPDVLEFTVKQFNKYYSDQIKFVVVDDNSDNPDDNRKWADIIGDYHYNTERLGVAKTKNKCIELLDTEHVFLFDDDCFPTRKEWWKPWLIGVDHLVLASLPHIEVNRIKEDQIWWNGAYGCCLYLSRKCIDTVGGFDKRFGMWGYEHAELTGRIKRAGLIPHPYISPKVSGLWSFDADGSFDGFHWEDKSSVSQDEKNRCIQEAIPAYNAAIIDKSIYR